MAKFRIRLKVQALELEIDGEREDIPALGAAVRQQLGGILEPAELTIETKQITESRNGHSPDDDGQSKGKGKAPRKRAPSASRGAQDATAVDFRHDSAKYANPVQSWNVAEKSIWLLYVLKNVANLKEVSVPQIAATFNQNFKNAGAVHPPHVSRELARAKVLNPAPVGENRGAFYLTDEGERQAKDLIQNVSQSS